MPHKTDGGMWRHQITLPDGTRISFEDRLQGVVKQWVIDTRAAIKNGTYRSPHQTVTTVGDWWPIWWAARTAGRRTLIDNEAIWRLHVEPDWGKVPLTNQAITKLKISGWAKELGERLAEAADDDDRPDAGTRTVQKAVSLLSMLLQAACDEDPPILARNPARGVRAQLPPTVTRPPRYLIPEEHAAIVKASHEPWRTLIDFAGYAGLRWGELAGLPVENVDLRARLVHVYVVSDHGRIREYPKSKKSRRSVPIPEHLLDRFADLTRAMPRGSFVFRMPDEEPNVPLNYYTWRRHWYDVVRAARTCPPGTCRPTPWGPCAKAEHAVPEYSPHVLRHTAASWLVMRGMDLYRVQALLGHEDYKTTERYSHLSPKAFDGVADLWSDIRRDTQDAPKLSGKKVSDPRKGR